MVEEVEVGKLVFVFFEVVDNLLTNGGFGSELLLNLGAHSVEPGMVPPSLSEDLVDHLGTLVCQFLVSLDDHLGLVDYGYPFALLVLFEIDFLLGLTFEIDVEPLSELALGDQQVVEEVLVDGGVNDDQNLVLAQTDLLLNSAHLSQLCLDVVHHHLVLGIREKVFNHFLLLVQVTEALFPLQNFFRNFSNRVMDFGYSFGCFKQVLKELNQF